MKKPIKGLLLTVLYIFSLFNCAEIDPDVPDLQDYEKEHIDYLRKNAAECTLFLNRDTSFPLTNPGRILLVGAGGTKTLKGGTGSGDVNSRYYTTIEEGLEKAGFEIVSKDWYSKYIKFKEQNHDKYVSHTKTVAEGVRANAGHISFGRVEPEPEYNIPLTEYKADVAIYVVSRISGEGDDRHITKGDIYLTDSEVKDILELDRSFNSFMLVLNTVGVVDLTPVRYVSNILYLSQLGVVTGDILADIVLGKVNPSGKLASTWAGVKQYGFIEEFGGNDNTRYLEGVYVGYRYFDSIKRRPLFPFGYGKSYTSFSIKKGSISNSHETITVNAIVKNTGRYAGKEVVQVYVSPSQENKDKPYQSLVGFKKTKRLDPEDEQTLKISFKLSDIARYDTESAKYILDKGKYIIRVGNSSDKTEVYGFITLKKDIVTEELKNIGGESDFGDFIPDEIIYDDDLTDVDEIILEEDDFKKKTVDYTKYKPKINSKVKSLKIEDVGKLCIGKFEGKTHVPGAAGETVLTIDSIKDSLVLCDGPAGVRITQNYEDSEGKMHYQFTTAIPIATAIAQSFNEDFVENIGNIVGEEMDLFKIHLWLAPALNIHRNIQNGRNFEYYSEDPLISGLMAAAITRGVQMHPNRGTTIKHFACNGQEWNRFNSNSILSERALREIYLKGFKIAIDNSYPHSLMTSYNLINGVHSSERKDLIVDVIRSEWEYEGLIMSDWYSSGHYHLKVSNYPNQEAVNNIKAGNDLQMGGGVKDYNLVMEAYEKGILTEDDLLVCASKVYDYIELLNSKE